MEIPEGFELVTPPSGQGGLATTFGYNDREDNGVGAWGDKTNNPDIVGVSLPRQTLRDHFGDENAAHGALVEVSNPSTGKSILAPIVDKGPAKWVVDRQGPTIDLTHAANRLIGGTGRTPVQFRIIGHAKDGLPDGFEPVNDSPVAPAIPDGFELVDTESPVSGITELPTASPRIADDLALKSWKDPDGNTVSRPAGFALPQDRVQIDPSQAKELPNPFVEFGARVAKGTDTSTRGAIASTYDMAATPLRKFKNDYFGRSQADLLSEQDRLTNESNRLLNEKMQEVEPSNFASPEETAITSKLDKIRDALAGKPESFLGSMARATDELAADWDANRQEAGKKYEPFISAARNSKWGMQLADSIGQSIPGTVAAIANPAFGLSVMYAQNFDNARQEYADSMQSRGLSVDPDKMSQYAHDQAMGQTPWELAGEVKLGGALKAIFKSIPDKAVEGGAESFGKWVGKAIKENAEAIAGETLITTPAQSLEQDLIAERNGVQDKTSLSSKFAKIPGQMTIAAAQAGLMGGVPTLAAATLKAREIRKSAREKPQTFTNLSDIPDVSQNENQTPPQQQGAPADSQRVNPEASQADRPQVENPIRNDVADTPATGAGVDEDTEYQKYLAEELADLGADNSTQEAQGMALANADAGEGMKMPEGNPEGGFVVADVPQGIVDFGRSIYSKGMDFLDWSMQMVKTLGKDVQAHLRKLWDAIVAHYTFIGDAGIRGALGSKSDAIGESIAAEAQKEKGIAETLAPLNKKPDARLDIYEKAKAKLADVIERHGQNVAELETLGADTTSIEQAAEKKAAEIERATAEKLRQIDADEAGRIAKLGGENVSKFFDRTDRAKGKEARAAFAQASRETATKQTEAVRREFEEKRRTVEAESKGKLETLKARTQERIAGRDNAEVGRAQVVRSLAKLEAITSVLPPAVRGNIGGATKMASLRGEQARTTFLNDRVEKISKVLDAHLKDEYVSKIEKTLDKATPKKGTNGIAKGKVGSAVHGDLAIIESVIDMNADQLAAHLAGLEGEVNAATSPEQLSDALNRYVLAGRFGNLADRTADDLSQAWSWMKDAVKGGRESWRMQEESRKQDLKDKEMRALMELERPHGVGPNDLAIAQEKDSKWGRLARDFVEGILAWHQDLGEAFGTHSKTAQEYSRKVWDSTNRYEDSINRMRDRFHDDMKGLFGVRGQLGLHKVLERLSAPQQTNAVFLEGRIVKTLRIPIERAVDAVMNGRADAYGLTSYEDLAQVQAMIDEAGGNPRRRTIQIEKVENPGTPVAQRMSELEAVNYLLGWAQPDVRAKMERQGITAKAIAELEKFVSPEGKAVQGWLKDRYAEEYSRLNEVFRRMFGIDMPKIENYAPTFVDTSKADKSNAGPDGVMATQSGLVPGSLKARVSHNELFARTNAMEAFWRHTTQQEYWLAFAETNREIRSVLGNSKVLQSVRATYGGGMEERLKKWFEALEKNGLKASDSYSKISNAMRSWMGGTALSALGGKIGVILKQASAATNFLLEVPAPEVAKSMGRMLTGNFSTSLPAVWNSDTIQRRIKSGVSPAVRAVMNRGGWNPGALLVVAEKGMAPIGLADTAFNVFGAAVAFDYHYHAALKSGMDERGATSYAAGKMDEVVQKTAQPASVANRSMFEASNNPFSKAVFMFMSELRQKAAISYLAGKRLMRGEDKRMNAQRLAVAWVVMSVITQTMSNMYRTFFKDDDRKDIWNPVDYARAVLVGPIAGVPILGPAMESAVRSATGGKVYPISSNPFDSALKALRDKRANPMNWQDSEDAIVGASILARAMAQTSGILPFSAAAMTGNAMTDAMHLIKNLSGHRGEK